MQLRSFGLPLATVFLSVSFAGAPAGAQSAPPARASTVAPRVTGDWRGSAAIAIANSKPPANAFAADLGVAPANQAIGRMLLLLAPSEAQQQALTAELASLQNSASPSYRKWLTPQAFAQSYSVCASDAAAVSAWLQSEGFTVAPLPAGLGWIEFSGSAAQVEQAFGAQIHLVSVSGAPRAALTSGISVPAALSPVIAGLVSLDGSLSAPALTTPQSLSVQAADLAAVASSANAAALTPKLVAQSVDLAPLAAAGLTGAGETIAIVSRGNVNSVDVAAFRSAFGLAASPLKIAVDGDDPGLTDDRAEATLAASWAGAAAPDARILLAPAASTVATDGVDLSLASIVDRDSANVVAIGYSACEAALGAAHQQFYSALYRQASAEGISIVAASGDGGAAACTPAGGNAAIGSGYGVNALASTQWNAVVGVAGYGSTGAAAGNPALAAWSPLYSTDPAYAGGGGGSTIHARPAWQPLPAQLASGNAATAQNRLLPDLALPTAIDSGVNPGLAFCLSGAAGASGCTLMRSGGSGAATAYFAGIAALLDQKYGAQGNLAPGLYATSQAASASFNDVAQGAAQLPCVVGASGCGENGQIGYAAASGYDLASGLGVPDAQKLLNGWTPFATSSIAPTFTLAISPVNTSYIYNPSATATFTAKVVDSTGAGIPTGTVAIYDRTSSDTLTSATALTSSGSTSSGSSATFTYSEISTLFTNASLSATGTYYLGLVYADSSGTYTSSDSSTLLTVTLEKSPVTLTVASSSTSPAVGAKITVTVTATASLVGSVAPSGDVTLYVNGSASDTSTLTSTSTSGVYTATFSVTVPSTTTTIYATYAGDDYYDSATSSTTTITATKALATVVLSASSTTVTYGSAVVLTATVTPSSTTSTSNPTGTVIFYNGTTVIGTATLSAVSNTYYSIATLTTQTLSGGTDTLTAVYQGDTNYGAATSNSLTLTVEGFTLTASSSNPATNLDIVKGGAGSESFIVTSIGGYTSTVQVLCTVATQDDMTCTPTPQQVTPTATVTFVVQTYTTGGPAYSNAVKPRLPGSRWPQAAAGVTLAALFFFLLPFGRRARTFLHRGPRRFLVLLVLLAGLAGAGIGCTSTTVTSSSSTGTPLGVATLKVTATAYVNNVVTSQNLYFTVNVTAK